MFKICSQATLIARAIEQEIALLDMYAELVAAIPRQDVDKVTRVLKPLLELVCIGNSLGVLEDLKNVETISHKLGKTLVFRVGTQEFIRITLSTEAHCVVSSVSTPIRCSESRFGTGITPNAMVMFNVVPEQAGQLFSFI